MDLRDQMDRIYGEMPLDKIPWHLEDPPRLLVDLVESGRVEPGDAVDLGCGAGSSAIWLASRGFRVTGYDLSSRALELASQRAAELGVGCRFAAHDLTAVDFAVTDRFDFAFDWEVLHHVFPEQRAQYVRNVQGMLRPGGIYLSVCFSEDDAPSFYGEGKYRTTPLGTELYFSSEAELRELFGGVFSVRELRSVEIEGKLRPHLAVVGVMGKDS